MRFGVITVLLIALLAVVVPVSAQGQPVACGDIIEGTFTENDQAFFYSIDLSSGDQIRLSGSTVGSTPEFAIALFDPARNDLVGTSDWPNTTQPYTESQVLGASGRYTIGVANTIIDSIDNWGRMREGGLGTYYLMIGCTIGSTGEVVEPGQTQENTTTSESSPSVPVPAFGFPGLAPVDFASAFRLPLALGTPMEGEIPESGSAVLGFYVSGNAGDTLDLSFERISGNINLGIVVLSANSQVAYMAALVSSQTMSSRFSLPTAGEYTIGIFRLDLVPPASPETTRFRITALLNS